MKTFLRKLLAVFLLIPVTLMLLGLLAIPCWILYSIVAALADRENLAVFLIVIGTALYVAVSVTHADWAFGEVVTLLPKFKRKPKGADHERE